MSDGFRPPTPYEVNQARAVLENCNDADALMLSEVALLAAWKWRVVDELAASVLQQDEEASKAIWIAFEKHQ